MVGEANRVLEPYESPRVIRQIRHSVLARIGASIASNGLLEPIQQIIVGLKMPRSGVLLDVVVDVPQTHITQTELRGIIAVRLHTANAQHDERIIEKCLKVLANYSEKTSFCNRSDYCCEAREVY